MDGRRVALGVAGGVAEAVKEIARPPGGLGDPRLGIARDERAVVIDDVEFALHGINHDVAGGGAVIERVAVQPVAPQGFAGHVDVDPARPVGDALAFADVMGLGGVHILHDVIEDPCEMLVMVCAHG